MTPDERIDAVLNDRSVIVCCGAGGVGKTTMSAAIGLAAAQRGRKVVVITVDPARRLGEALGLADGLGADPRLIECALADGGELWAMMLDPEVELERVIRSHAVRPGQADEALANPFTRSIGSALGGTQEFMVTEVVYRLVHDERFDLVVVDTPPSDRAMEVIEAPDVLVRFLDHQVFKLLMGTGGRAFRLLSAATQPLLRAVGRVIGTAVLDDVVGFLRSFTGMEASFRERAVAVRKVWRADSTAFVLVTAPRPDTVEETRRFAEQLSSLGVGTDLVIANRCAPAIDVVPGDDEWAPAAAGSDPVDAARSLADWSARLFEAESEVLAGLDAPIRVERRPGDVHDLDALSALARAIGT